MSSAPSSAVAAIMSAAGGASSFFEQAASVSVALHSTTSKDRFAVTENMANPFLYAPVQLCPVALPLF
jgi:hypothetical protein